MKACAGGLTNVPVIERDSEGSNGECFFTDGCSYWLFQDSHCNCVEHDRQGREPRGKSGSNPLPPNHIQLQNNTASFTTPHFSLML